MTHICCRTPLRRAVFAVLAVATAAPFALGADQPETYGATASLKTTAGASVTAPVTISITRWTTDGERDNARVTQLLDRLVEVARNPDENLLPVTIELVDAGATMGDIVEKLKALWGTYRETPVF